MLKLITVITFLFPSLNFHNFCQTSNYETQSLSLLPVVPVSLSIHFHNDAPIAHAFPLHEHVVFPKWLFFQINHLCYRIERWNSYAKYYPNFRKHEKETKEIFGIEKYMQNIQKLLDKSTKEQWLLWVITVHHSLVD